ncbi:MAG: phosphoribosylformylglycinamidine cyclo-ligase [Candidatus Aminicenantes bacterium]|nr:phosphoribosylformylglycinamidine cyclo-ligase [Candidatus Aminicenantes bacterium]
MCAQTYKDAGVDIDKAENFIRQIIPLIKKTHRPEVLGKIGGFSGLFMPQLKKMRNPVLVSSTDGVGTKLLIAEALGTYDTIGIDLVAMCVDDVVVVGAEPLFFLDYIACGKLDEEKLSQVMKGIVKGCREAGCALIGGETAELPGLYEANKFDLAGFCVGVVSKEKIIDGCLCKKGDKVVGLASSGLHSNGFSLVRKLFSKDEIRGKLGHELLKPTKIYTKTILQIKEKLPIKAMAHITGGGFYDNIPRSLPKGMAVRIQKGTWTVHPIFKNIQKRGKLETKEMFRTFNMGIGMTLILSPRYAERALSILKDSGEKAAIIGEVIKGPNTVEIVD